MKTSSVVIVVATVLSGLAAASAFAQSGAPATCRQGYVWREAFAGDYVCVTPAARAQAWQDNGQAATRRQPGGGAYGPNTCVQGYVWREAGPGDLVCVTPATRAQAAADNREAAGRRAAAAPAPTAPAAPAPQVATAYRTGEWSRWTRFEGIEYRYRWGFNPADRNNGKDVDALYQVRSVQGRNWEGEVRSLDCKQNFVSRGQRVVLQPGQAKDVKFVTPNCGTREQPSFRPNVVKSVRID